MPLFFQKATEETRIGQKLGCVIVDPTCQLPEAFLTACNIDLDRRQWPSSLNLVDLPKLDCSFSAYELLPFILQAFIVGDTAMFSKLILVIHRNPYMLNYLQKVFDFPGLEMNFLRARCATLLRDIDDTSADDGVEKIVKKTLVHCKMWSARLLNKSRAVWWFACVILFPFLERENAQELIKIGLDYLGNSLTLDDYSVNFSCEFICQSLVVCQAKMTGEQHEIFVTALKVKLEHASCCGQKTWLMNCLICCGCAYDILMPMGTLLSQGDDFAKCIASNIRLVLQHLQADRCSANLFLSIQAGRRQYTSQFRRVPKGSHIHVQLRKLIMFGQDNFKRWLDSKNYTLCEAAFLFLPAFARELSVEQIGDFLDYVECWMQSFSLSDNIFDIRERVYTAVLQLYSILPISTEVRVRCERILCLCVGEAIEAVRSRLKDLALIQLKPDYDLLQQLSLLQIIDEQDVQAIDAIIKSIMATPSGEIDKGIASFLDLLGNESAAVRQFACTKFVRIVHLLPPVVLERVITEINDLDVLECKLLARILNVYTKGHPHYMVEPKAPVSIQAH